VLGKGTPTKTCLDADSETSYTLAAPDTKIRAVGQSCAKGDRMGRLLICILVLAMMMTGCHSPAPAQAPGSNAQDSDGREKLASSPFPGNSGWLDDHPFTVCAGVVVAALVVASVVTALAVSSLFGHVI